MSNEGDNHCVECGIDLGECNPRQLCGKTHCLYEFAPTPTFQPATSFEILISDIINMNLRDTVNFVTFLKQHETCVQIYEDLTKHVRFVELDGNLIIKFNNETKKVIFHRYSIFTPLTNIREWSIIYVAVLYDPNHHWVIDDTFRIEYDM